MTSWEKCLFGSLAHFFKLDFFILHCMISLYNFYINPLSNMSSSDIFSHLVGCFVVLLVISSLHKSFLVWYSPIWLLLLLLPLLRRHSQKISLTILYVFFPRGFRVSGLMSLFHFEFIFVYVVRKWSSFPKFIY